MDRSEGASGEEAKMLAGLSEVRCKSKVGKSGEADCGTVDSGVIFGAAVEDAAATTGPADFGFEAPSSEAESRAGGTMDEPAAVMGVPGDVDFGGTGAFGATDFGATSFGATLAVTAGTEGLAAPLPGAFLAGNSPIFAAAGRTGAGTCEPLEAGGRAVTGAGWAAEPM